MASGNDLKAANRTYGQFINLIKYSVPPILIITAIVIWLIA